MTDVNILDKLGKALFFLGFIGAWMTDTDAVLVFLAMMLVGGLIEWHVDKQYAQEEG